MNRKQLQKDTTIIQGSIKNDKPMGQLAHTLAI